MISLYHPQGPRRLISVEMSIEGDFVPYLGLTVVNPCIRNMGQHFTPEIALDVLLQRNAFSVAQIGIRLRLSVLVATDCSGFVAFPKGCEHGIKLWVRKAYSVLPVQLFEIREELLTVFVEFLLRGLI